MSTIICDFIIMHSWFSSNDYVFFIFDFWNLLSYLYLSHLYIAFSILWFFLNVSGMKLVKWDQPAKQHILKITCVDFVLGEEQGKLPITGEKKSLFFSFCMHQSQWSCIPQLLLIHIWPWTSDWEYSIKATAV